MEKAPNHLMRESHSLVIRPLMKEDQSWWDYEESLMRIIQEQKDLRVKDREYHFSAFHKEENKIGSIAIKGVIRENLKSAYLELAFDKKEIGDFLMIEAIISSCDLAFHEVDLHRLEVLALSSSLQLKNILKRASFREEGLRKYAVYDGKDWQDAQVFAITKKEYEDKNLHQLMKASLNLR